MKKWNGYSSEKKKCLYCNSITYDYVTYEVNGIEIKINCHIECFKSIDNIAKKTFRNLKEQIKIDLRFNENN